MSSIRDLLAPPGGRTRRGGGGYRGRSGGTRARPYRPVKPRRVMGSPLLVLLALLVGVVIGVWGGPVF